MRRVIVGGCIVLRTYGYSQSYLTKMTDERTLLL